MERCDPQTCDGGVFAPLKNDLIATRATEFETDCEILWVRVDIAGSKTLHIGAFYRPNISDNTALPELQSSLSRIPQNHLVVLGGDFNLPDIDWNMGSVKPGSRYTGHHEKLLEIIDDTGLTQHVND